MYFTDAQIAQFHTQGYLAVPDFWTTREIVAMRAELDRLKAAGKLNNVAADGDGKTVSQTKINLQLCPLFPHSDFFRAMPFAPKVAAAVESLIGGPVLLHLDQVFIKPGKQGAGTNWHQDNAYFKIPEPLRGTALWTAVHDATVENGTLRVIPAAFAEALPHTRDGDSDHHIRCYPDESNAVPLQIGAGGALFFCYGTPHATGSNHSAHERAGIALHFLRTDQNTQAEGGFAKDKRALLTGPASTGGEAEYGERIAGTWDAQVARVLAG